MLYLSQLMSSSGNPSVACQPAYQAAATGPQVVAREVTRWRIDNTIRERTAKDIAAFSNSKSQAECVTFLPLAGLSTYTQLSSRSRLIICTLETISVIREAGCSSLVGRIQTPAFRKGTAHVVRHNCGSGENSRNILQRFKLSVSTTVRLKAVQHPVYDLREGPLRFMSSNESFGSLTLISIWASGGKSSYIFQPVSRESGC